MPKKIGHLSNAGIIGILAASLGFWACQEGSKPPDAWGPLIELRDNTSIWSKEKPDGGWWVTPIHASLLPNGKVLITGWSRSEPDLRAVRHRRFCLPAADQACPPATRSSVAADREAARAPALERSESLVRVRTLALVRVPALVRARAPARARSVPSARLEQRARETEVTPARLRRSAQFRRPAQ